MVIAVIPVNSSLNVPIRRIFCFEIINKHSFRVYISLEEAVLCYCHIHQHLLVANYNLVLSNNNRNKSCFTKITYYLLGIRPLISVFVALLPLTFHDSIFNGFIVFLAAIEYFGMSFMYKPRTLTNTGELDRMIKRSFRLWCNGSGIIQLNM